MQATDLAFPTETRDWFYPGMDIRTYIATHICAGLMVNDQKGSKPEFAKHAVDMADALILELNKSK